jgi:putative oxidoreductase
MTCITDFFLSRDNSSNTSNGLLFMRICVGIIMAASHGWSKLANFGDMSASFADPIGLGSNLSLFLAVFAEFFCSIALIFGIATRAVVIPLIVTMLVAVFVVHGNDPWMKQEFGVLYLIPYITLLIAGSGRYSLDYILFRKNNNGVIQTSTS